MNATPQERAFHQRMLAKDDPAAPAELAEWLYPLLVSETYARACARSAGGSASVDRNLVEEAVGEALLAYIDAPESYDPERAALQRYLVMASFRDYQNLSAKEARRTGPQRYLSLLATEPEEAMVDEGQDVDRIIERIHAENLWKEVEKHFPDPIDWQIAKLIVERVREPQPYAELLGLTHMPGYEQKKEVERVKDRIARRLRRIGENLHE